jgi:hypothetical protein
MNVWNEADELSAINRCWSVFTCDDGKTRIQKLDDPPVHHLWVEGMPEECLFNSDTQAVALVRRLAKNGDVTAIKALSLHNKKVSEKK